MKKLPRFKILYLATALAVLVLAVLVLSSGDRTEINSEKLYEITLKDPLFYDAGFNAEKLSKSVAGLKNQEKILRSYLLKRYPSDLEKIPTELLGPVKDYYSSYLSGGKKTFLYPLAFLELLPVVAEDTDLFLDKKNSATGIKLLKDYEKAAAAYQKAARDQRGLIQGLAGDPILSKKHYVELSSATSLGIMLSDFSLIEKNGEALLKEIEKRKHCFYGGDCPPIVRNKPVAKPAAASPLPDKLIPESLLEITGLKSEKVGPYAVRTKCFGNSKENPEPEKLMYIFLESPPKPGLVMPIFNPKLVDENFYYDLSFNPTVVGKTLRERGIDFYFQPEGANYLCADLGYWTDLALAATGSKLGYFPEMINILANNLATLRNALNFDPLPHPANLTIFFSNYSLVYMPFDESVWKIREKPSYMETEALRPIAYRTYSELSKKYDDAAIKKFHFRFSDARDELLSQMEAERSGGFEEIIHRLLFFYGQRE